MRLGFHRNAGCCFTSRNQISVYFPVSVLALGAELPPWWTGPTLNSDLKRVAVSVAAIRPVAYCLSALQSWLGRNWRY